MSVAGYIAKVVTGEASETINLVINKIGMTSIASTVGITTAQKSDAIPETTMRISEWLMTDYALVISMITGMLFGIEKLITISFKVWDRYNDK